MSNRMIVIGTGPIGGIIGGRLARAGHDITFVDVDREHVQAIREKGLQVEVPDGSFNVKVKILFPDEIEGKYDIGLIAVRSNYTPDALRAVLPQSRSRPCADRDPRPSLYRPCARQDDAAAGEPPRNTESGYGNRYLGQYSRRALEQAHLHLLGLLRFACRRFARDELRR